MPHFEGKPAPAFTLQGSDGKTHSLSDYIGRQVLVYFYPRDDTPGCTKEACGFRDLEHEFAAHDTIILGVSKDNLGSHDKFISKFNLPFVLLTDPDTITMQAYGAWGEKKLYGKIGLGCIRSTVLIGADGNIIKRWGKVKNAADHPAEVLSYLKG